jgi:hypothetical protein
VSRGYVTKSHADTITDVVQLVTRIPYQLRHRTKIRCVAHDTTFDQFLIDAIRERLETHVAPTSPDGGPCLDDGLRL